MAKLNTSDVLDHFSLTFERANLSSKYMPLARVEKRSFISGWLVGGVIWIEVRDMIFNEDITNNFCVQFMAAHLLSLDYT